MLWCTEYVNRNTGQLISKRMNCRSINMTELCLSWQECVVLCCWISVEHCLLFISVCGFQMLKSYLRSYPDLSPDSLGGFTWRQLDFVTSSPERPLQWTELKKKGFQTNSYASTSEQRTKSTGLWLQLSTRTLTTEDLHSLSWDAFPHSNSSIHPLVWHKGSWRWLQWENSLVLWKISQ